MSATRRVVWLIVLLIFTAGCSTYKVASLPRFEETSEPAGDEENPVNVGDRVRITLIDGTEVKGRIMAIEPDTITLTAIRNVGARHKKTEPNIVMTDRIRVIERSEVASDRTSALLIGALVTAAVIAVVVVGFAKSVEEGFEVH